MVRNTFIKCFKRRTYFKSYLINLFLYKNIFTEFPVLKNHVDNVTENELLIRDHMSKCDKSTDFKGVL